MSLVDTVLDTDFCSTSHKYGRTPDEEKAEGMILDAARDLSSEEGNGGGSGSGTGAGAGGNKITKQA